MLPSVVSSISSVVSINIVDFISLVVAPSVVLSTVVTSDLDGVLDFVVKSSVVSSVARSSVVISSSVVGNDVDCSDSKVVDDNVLSSAVVMTVVLWEVVGSGVSVGIFVVKSVINSSVVISSVAGFVGEVTVVKSSVVKTVVLVAYVCSGVSVFRGVVVRIVDAVCSVVCG